MDQKMKKDILEIQEFHKKHGRPPIMKDFGGRHRAIANRHGSWNQALINARLNPVRVIGKRPLNKEELITKAKNISKDGELHFGDFGSRTRAIELFGSWGEFLNASGLKKPNRSEPNYLNKPFSKYTDDELITHIQRRSKELGRTPRVLDLSISTTIINRFGSWTNALTLAKLPLNNDYIFLTKEELILKAKEESVNGYLSSKKFTYYKQAVKEFHTWENFKIQCGLTDKDNSMRRIRTTQNKNGVSYAVSSVTKKHLGTFKTLEEAKKARDEDYRVNKKAHNSN